MRTQTIDFKERKHIILKTTGFSSMRITAFVAMCANGKKCPPLKIHKSNKKNVTRIGNSLLVVKKLNAWVDTNLII